jgi:hypothetical protein
MRAHFVGVRSRVEPVGGLLLDQLPRELQLAVLYLGPGNVDVLDRSHFRRVEQLLHDEAVLARGKYLCAAPDAILSRRDLVDISAVGCHDLPPPLAMA